MLPGVDPDGEHRTTAVAILLTDGTWLLHVPSGSRTVRLQPSAAAELARALSPEAPAEVIVALRDHAGKVGHVLYAPIRTGHRVSLPGEVISSLQRALRGLTLAQSLFGTTRQPSG